MSPYCHVPSLVIKGLHHAALRCSDSGATRRFYEDLLGLPLVATLRIEVTKTARQTDALHTFFRMADGSCLAFFEAPDLPFDFKRQHDYDLHLALEVDHLALLEMKDRSHAAGVETRGVVDHGMFESLYLRDPDGYVIELTCKAAGHDTALDPTRNQARARLDRWLAERPRAVTRG